MSHQRVLGICADSRGMVNLSGFRSRARHWQDILIYLAQTLLSGHSELDLSSLLCAGTLLLASSLPGPPHHARRWAPFASHPHLHLIVLPVAREVT